MAVGSLDASAHVKMTVSLSRSDGTTTCGAAAATTTVAGGPTARGFIKLRKPVGAPADGLGPDWMFWKRRRYVLACLAFFGFAVSMVMRVNMAVAIVDMTDNKTWVDSDNITRYGPQFNWNSKEEGVVLSAFFYGYIFTTLPGGWISARYGGKWVFGIGMLGTAVFTLIVPPLSEYGVNAIIALRVLVGLFEGVTWPSMHALWARWAPPLERARLANFALTGLSMGPVVGMASCGVLADVAGWPSTFYVTGAAGIIWFVVWCLLARDSPDDDPFITIQEKKFIEESLGSARNEVIRKRPWGRILLSLPVWSVAVAHFCEGWGYTTFLTQLPTFMKQTLDFNLKASGMLSALPYVAMIVSLPSVSILSDWLVTRGHVTITQARKLFNCTAFLAQSIFLFGATRAETPVGVVACMTLAQGIGAFACCGFSVNPLDLAPQYASVIMGLSCTISTLSGMISPLLTGYIVTEKTRDQWNIVFYIASSIYLFGALFYGLFASGERQSWAMDKKPTGAAENSTQADLVPLNSAI